MSLLVAAPEMISAAASVFARIELMISAANAAAVAPTTRVLAATFCGPRLPGESIS
jgi:PE family